MERSNEYSVHIPVPFLLRRTEAKRSLLPPSVSLGSPHRSYGNHTYYLAPSLSLPSWESVRLARFFSYYLFSLSFFFSGSRRGGNVTQELAAEAAEEATVGEGGG